MVQPRILVLMIAGLHSLRCDDPHNRELTAACSKCIHALERTNDLNDPNVQAAMAETWELLSTH